ADAQSLVEAARRLGKTPSGVSMALKNLESQIGGALFASERKNQLTPLGQWVLVRARQDLAQFDATVRAINDQVAHQGRNLRIGAVPSVMVHLMPAVVADYMAGHPNAHLELNDMDSVGLQQALESDQLDLVIRSHVETVDDPLMVDPLGWVLPADHPLADADALSMRELAGDALLSNRLCQQAPTAWLRELDAQAPLRIHNTASLLAMVRAGLGITVLPRLAAQGVHGDATGVAFVPCATGDVRHLKVHCREQPSVQLDAFIEGLRRVAGTVT
ncbi:MAG: LysR family transcriptional regulator, partial [Litorivicinus sp.]